MQSDIERVITHDLSLFDKVNNLTTLKRLTKDLNIRYLASGTYSQVLSLKVEAAKAAKALTAPYKADHSLILKIATLAEAEDQCDEWTFAQYLNKLIKVNQGPHFLYAYKLLTFADRSYCFIQDKAEFDLTHILKMKLSKGVQVSLFVQLMIALHIIQSRYQMTHRDVKSENIFLRTLREPTKVTYETDFGTFTLTLEGYWLYLGDFNVSYSFHPGYTQHRILGERNAKLVGTTLIPIRTRTTPHPSKKIFWTTGQATYRIFLRADMTFVDKINAYNPHTYPPFEFIDDTIDACRTFIGGPRCLLNLYHQRLIYLDADLYETLSTLIFSDSSYREGTFDVNKGYLCNAGLLLQKFWTELRLGEGEVAQGLLYNLKGIIRNYR